MNQKPKPKPKKQLPWTSFAYLASLAKKKEHVIIYLNSNTIDDESVLRGVIIDADNYTLAFLASDGRELLVFKHAVKYIERIKQK